MIPVTLMINKSTAIGAELPQVPGKGDLVVFGGQRYQVAKVTWILDQRSTSTAGCSDVFVSLRSVA